MKSRAWTVLAAIVGLALGARSALACIQLPTCTTGPEVQWTPADGGNGHFYQAICSSGTWEQAENAAIAAGRHLATVTSTEENAFVFGLIDHEGFWTATSGCNLGPWLGGFQPPGSGEPSDDWSWVTGEPFDFVAWEESSPNNVGGEEDHLHYFESCGGDALRTSTWNDAISVSSFPGYVTEWEHSLDADGDGQVLALNDGILFLRSLFDFTGLQLTANAVNLDDCSRCDAAAIQPFLDAAFAGSVYDVGADWSDSANPNGPWSYLEGTDPLPHVASWQSSVGGYTSAQPAWAASENGNNRVPVFMKSLGFEDFTIDAVAGDVVVHSRDDTSGVGQGDARLRFTAPASGIYRIDLDVWIARDIGRQVTWALSVDGAQQAAATLFSGDIFSRASPNGYEGSHALEAGDVVDLVLTPQPATSPGDFVGIKLRLEAFGLDVDGDGEVLALNDGLLVLRYMFDFTGTNLTAGAVNTDDCTRCDATAIIEFLDSFD